jgi:hypothetical protein
MYFLCSMYFCVVLCTFCVPCIFVLFYILFVLCRSLYCLCVHVYSTTATDNMRVRKYQMCTETFCFISVFMAVSFIEVRRRKYLCDASRRSLETARLSVQCAKLFFPRDKATWTRRLGQFVAEVINLQLPCHIIQSTRYTFTIRQYTVLLFCISYIFRPSRPSSAIRLIDWLIDCYKTVLKDITYLITIK